MGNKLSSQQILAWCLVLIGSLLLIHAGYVQPTVHAQEDVIRLRILYTSDEEGALLPSECKDTGGAAGIIQLWEKQENCHDDTRHCLIISRGDIFTSDPIGSLFHGETIVDVMNAMEYNVLVLDNHELDFGVANARKLKEQANFEFVSANYVANDHRQTFSIPAVIKEYQGVRIGIVGLSTGPEVLNHSSANEIDQPKARDYAGAVQTGLNYVEQQGGADIYILAYHPDITNIPQELLDRFDLHLGSAGSEDWRTYLRIDMEIDPASKTIIDGPRQGNPIPNYYSDTFKGITTSEAIADIFENNYLNTNVNTVIQTIKTAHSRLREEDKRYAVEVLHNDQFADGSPVFDFPDNVSAEAFAPELALAWYEAFPKADISVAGGGFRRCLSRGPIYISDLRGGLPFRDALVMFPATKSEFLDQYYRTAYSFEGITPNGAAFVNRAGAKEEWSSTRTYQVITNDFRAMNSKLGYGLSEDDIEIVADHWQKPTVEWFIANRSDVSERLFGEQSNWWQRFWQGLQRSIEDWVQGQQDNVAEWWNMQQDNIAEWWSAQQDDIDQWWQEQMENIQRQVELRWEDLQHRAIEEAQKQLEDFVNELCGGAVVPVGAVIALWLRRERRGRSS